MELAFWKFSTRCSLPCTQQYVGWARCSGDLTVPYAREREREREPWRKKEERERERERKRDRMRESGDVVEFMVTGPAPEVSTASV